MGRGFPRLSRPLIGLISLIGCGPCGEGMVMNDSPGRKATPPSSHRKSRASAATTASAEPLIPDEPECVQLAGPRRNLDVGALRVKATILGGHESSAVVTEDGDREQIIRVGEYVGAHCWRVRRVDMDAITVELVPREPGAAIQHSARLAVNDAPHTELARFR
jgi:Tfp pilus assembly protein PilP